jgi:hypothetical protein
MKSATVSLWMIDVARLPDHGMPQRPLMVRPQEPRSGSERATTRIVGMGRNHPAVFMWSSQMAHFARRRFAMTHDLGGLIEITEDDHDPPHPFMVVRDHGFLIDLSRISAELWDQNNVASCA